MEFVGPVDYASRFGLTVTHELWERALLGGFWSYPGHLFTWGSALLCFTA